LPIRRQSVIDPSSIRRRSVGPVVDLDLGAKSLDWAPNRKSSFWGAKSRKSGFWRRKKVWLWGKQAIAKLLSVSGSRGREEAFQGQPKW